MSGYEQFDGWWGERARLAWDTIAMRPTAGIPAWMLHVMDMPLMEEMTGHEPGSFAREPEHVYIAFQEFSGSCYNDQFIPRNPLTMKAHGFAPSAPRQATTGAERVVVAGREISSAEDVARDLETCVFPWRQREIESYDPDDPMRIRQMAADECAVQRQLGPNILKGPYGGGFQSFPCFHYTTYGYVNYFSAYALYPEIMERDFAQQADLAMLRNRASARAIIEGGLPRLLRLDHDMADSRGTLVRVETLDRLWFPHFARAVQPLLEAGIRLIWHCDGNLMQMAPRLLEAGLGGFQGFQYEDGMDYPSICRMTDRDGGPLLIEAGVSVTRTLPHGTRQDVREELKWLVDNGPPVGLFLGATSSIVPGTKRENILELMEGLRYYRERR